MSAYTHTTVSLVIALAGALPYLSSLDGSFVYDDKRTVLQNPDVVGPASAPVLPALRSLFQCDFWGNPMQGGVGSWTHNSYRPLTVLSFRLNF